MATPAQLLANRLNSQKSTGPRSAEGKAASSMNALRHGARAESLIIPGEDPAQLAELTTSYLDLYQPAGPEEELLVDTVIRADWTRRRMARLEVEAFNSLIQESDPPETALGLALQRDAAGANALQKIFRRQEAAQRQWYRARQELARLQSARRVLEQRRNPAERSQSAPTPPQSVSRTKSETPAPGGPKPPAAAFACPTPAPTPPAPTLATPGVSPRPLAPPSATPAPASSQRPALDPPAWRL